MKLFFTFEPLLRLFRFYWLCSY